MKLFPQYSTLERCLGWLMIGTCLLTIISCDSQLVRNGEKITGTIAVIELGQEMISSVNQTWDLLEQGDFNYPSDNKDERILQRMVKLSGMISAREDEIFTTVNITISSLSKLLTIDPRLDGHLQELLDVMNRINHRERMMRAYQISGVKEERLVGLEEFARRSVAQDANSVTDLLDNVDLLVAGTRDLPFSKPGILEQLLDATVASKSTICRLGLSAQQLFYQLYNAVVIAELKGYLLMQFSWMLLNAYGKGHFIGEANLMRRRFEDRSSRTQILLQRLMAQAGREYWRCDPEQHTEGDTFLQFTRLLQGYVVNEVDLNKNNTCGKTCAYYNKGYGNNQEQCYDHRYCPKQTRCEGKVYNCEFIASDMEICPTRTSSARRYDYVEYENKVVLGQKKPCTLNSTNVDSWWRWFYHCSYCFCVCDDASSRSDRYINLRESVSDIMSNKVVTGLRFVKTNRIIHLVVQQGTLLPRGRIADASLEWVNPEPYSLSSPNVSSGRDYHTLDYDHRSLDLDDIILKPSHVITGVRFRQVGTHLTLEARMTRMDFGTGKLVDLGKSSWVGSDKTKLMDEERTELKLFRPHVPLLTTSKSIPDSTPNQFIRFRESDRDKDAAQTTVPFIDAQPVTPHTRTALGGCGLYHKGQLEYGGFLAPKVFTYDYGPHVQAPS